jgi:hypothetical protein
MEIEYVALTTSNSKHFISRTTADKIYQSSNEDMVEMENGTLVKVSTIAEIMPLSEYNKQHPAKFEENYNYGQPYTALPAGRGYKGIIDLATDVSHILAIVKGLNKAKAKFNRPTPQIEEFLKEAREKYKKIKAGTYKEKKK